MDANICDINHLESDVLLPPRKRLLAELKKQSHDADFASRLSLVATSSSSSSDFNSRLNSLLKSHTNNPNLSPEEIAEASRSAAITAVKVAEAARLVADEKAAIATKAIAAAKSALDLVASFPEEEDCNERYLKRNKFKKQVPIQLLYKKYQPVKNFKGDEELARKLHRAINSSPRISKNSSGSDYKSHKHKKLKTSCTSVKSRASIGAVAFEGNGYAAPDQVDNEGSNRAVHTSRVDEKAAMKFDKAVLAEMDDEEAETTNKREKILEDTCATGKKRGRVKLKRLPLSICTFRDHESPKENITIGSSSIIDNNDTPTTGKVPLFSRDPSAETVKPPRSMWKCQEFKAPAGVKQNKVLQS